MKWLMILFYWITASLALATVPIDLQSPFLKTVIYQKKIGDYGAGPIEQKEVTQGVKKDGLYEFRKADGTLFLVSESEVLGVLPVFPTLQTPCEKGDVEAALRFLEKAERILPQQPEVAKPVLEKWKSLESVFGEIEKEWQVPADALDPSARNLFLGWVLGLPVVLLLSLVLGLLLISKRTGLALALVFIGLGIGILFWASLQAPTQVPTPLSLSHQEDCRRIFWAIAYAKKAGLAGVGAEVRLPIDTWLNFLFQRIRFSDVSSHGLRPAVSRPFFQKTADGVLVHQPLRVGPFVFPLTVEILPPKGQKNPEPWRVNKIRMGLVPWPTRLAETWVGKIFETYRFLWNEIHAGGVIEWKMGSQGEVEIRVLPRVP